MGYLKNVLHSEVQNNLSLSRGVVVRREEEGNCFHKKNAALLKQGEGSDYLAERGKKYLEGQHLF